MSPCPTFGENESPLACIALQRHRYFRTILVRWGIYNPRLSPLLHKILITKFVISTFVYFIQVAEFGVGYLFVSHCLRVALGNRRGPEKQSVLGPLLEAMRAKILARGLLRIIDGCDVDPVCTIMGFPRSGEVDWAAFNAVGWFLYDFDDSVIINVPGWTSAGQKRGREGELLPEVCNPKVTPKYVVEFQEAGMNRDYARAVWDWFKVTGVDLFVISLLDGQTAFLRERQVEPAEAEVEVVEDPDDDWDFERMVSVGEVAANGPRDKRREIHYICAEVGDAPPRTVVEAVDLPRKVVTTCRFNAALNKKCASTRDDLKSLRVVERAAVREFASAEELIKNIDAELTESKLAARKLTAEAAKAEENVEARIRELEKSL